MESTHPCSLGHFRDFSQGLIRLTGNYLFSSVCREKCQPTILPRLQNFSGPLPSPVIVMVPMEGRWVRFNLTDLDMWDETNGKMQMHQLLSSSLSDLHRVILRFTTQLSTGRAQCSLETSPPSIIDEYFELISSIPGNSLIRVWIHRVRFLCRSKILCRWVRSLLVYRSLFRRWTLIKRCLSRWMFSFDCSFHSIALKCVETRVSKIWSWAWWMAPEGKFPTTRISRDRTESSASFRSWGLDQLRVSVADE